MTSLFRFVPPAILLSVTCWTQFVLARWASQAFRARSKARAAIHGAAALVCGWILFSAFSALSGTSALGPSTGTLRWVHALAATWAVTSLAVLPLAWIARRLGRRARRAPEADPGRRMLLRTAQTALCALPFAAAGFGLVARNRFDVREIDLTVPGLARDLDGLRIVQLTDIHLSPFLAEDELERAVEMANGARAHLAVVTGDLITTRGDPLDSALAILSRLRSDAGVLGCLGNHEIYAGAEAYTARQGRRNGIRFLRGEACPLRFGSATLNVVGVDYQRMSRPYLRGVEKLVAGGACNLLLSHNPDVFPVAAAKGFQVTLSGHTHGGQVTVEILHRRLTLVRFLTPYIQGIYRQGASSLYVSRGIGTVAIPARVGAPPEITLVRLCAT